jgi:hypothetical protein
MLFQAEMARVAAQTSSKNNQYLKRLAHTFDASYF